MKYVWQLSDTQKKFEEEFQLIKIIKYLLIQGPSDLPQLRKIIADSQSHPEKYFLIVAYIQYIFDAKDNMGIQLEITLTDLGIREIMKPNQPEATKDPLKKGR